MALFLLIALMVGVADMMAVDKESKSAVEKRASVCFDKLGCFATDGPFTSPQRPVSVVPNSPDVIQTKFQLYSREGRTSPQILDARHPESAHTIWTHFKRRPTQFIVHGFLDKASTSSWMTEVKDALLNRGDYNVIIVDWSSGNHIPYDQATANTRIVGAQMGELIKTLIKTTGNSAASFHLIGHSLGSHVCGYAGERVPGLGRITGLDPAGPYFENTDKVVRLDPSDAVFVDTIHTDAKNLLQLGFGMKEQVGHSDFYPNLGHDQPGCTADSSSDIHGMEIFTCNHMRSIKLFTESITTKCPFLGYPCASEDDFKNNKCHSCTSAGCAAMGFNSINHIPPNGRHVKYYLTTAGNAPFCRS